MTTVQELRWLRDRLIGGLLASTAAGAPAVLDRLSELDPLVRARWVLPGERAGRPVPSRVWTRPRTATRLRFRFGVRCSSWSGAGSD